MNEAIISPVIVCIKIKEWYIYEHYAYDTLAHEQTRGVALMLG